MSGLLHYPLKYTGLSFDGPTLIYIDDAGNPIHLELSADEARQIIEDWNTRTAAEHSASDDVLAIRLRPPRKD